MGKLISRNFLYKALALLLAVLLWLYVICPTTEKPFLISVAAINLAEGFVLEEDPENVEVKVRGLSSTINALSSQEIKATVNLDTAGVGTGNYAVNVKLPSGLEIVSVKPANITLSVDEVQEKQLPIRVITQGTVATGYSYFAPVLEPSTVVVRGPSRFLVNLDTALITVNIDQARDNLILNPPVTLLTGSGEIVSQQFEISPPNIQVFVPITENTDNKTVSIKPNINGEPAEGYRVARVVLEPETVKITGNYESLSQIYQVGTAPIDITGITESYSTQVALVPPQGISLLYQPAIKVLVQVEEVIVTKNLEDVPLMVLNLAEENQVVCKPDKVQLVVKGTWTAMEKLEGEAVRALVDVAGLELGNHNLEVKAELPPHVQLVKGEPERVGVKISKKDEIEEG